MDTLFHRLWPNCYQEVDPMVHGVLATQLDSAKVETAKARQESFRRLLPFLQWWSLETLNASQQICKVNCVPHETPARVLARAKYSMRLAKPNQVTHPFLQFVCNKHSTLQNTLKSWDPIGGLLSLPSPQVVEATTSFNEPHPARSATGRRKLHVWAWI